MDTYAPTRAALEAFYPAVENGGIILIDDYGTHPDGAKLATNEFIKKLDRAPLLHRIDHGARLWVKI